jgi:hypothetical protein
MRIFIQDGFEKVPLHVKASDTIGQVKVMIEEKVRLPWYIYMLAFFRQEFHRFDSA